MEDFLGLNGGPNVATTTTDEGLESVATLTTTTCGSNGSPLVTRCYRPNYCLKGEPLVKPLKEVSLVKAAMRAKCCESPDEAPARNNCPGECHSSDASEGATGISEKDCGINLIKVGSLGETSEDKSSDRVSPTGEPVSKEGVREIPSFPTHYSYLSVSLVNSSPRVPPLEGETLPLNRQLSPRSRYPEETLSRNFHPRRISQSRPSSPPPATYFPPPRRPSLSLPPSPQSARIHRVSLPSNAFMSLSLPSATRSVPSSTPSSPSISRPRTPTPPPINRRSPRRRSARTPSPRPPLPPQATNEPPALPQQPPPPPPNRSRQQECQPYKMRMRSR